MLTKFKFIKQNLKKNLVFFYNQSNIKSSLSEYLSNYQLSQIKNIISDNKSEDQDFSIFNLNSSQKIIIINVKDIFDNLKNEKIGAKLYDFLKKNHINELNVLERNIDTICNKNKIFLNDVLLGFKIKSYNFNKYKTNTKNKLITIFLPKNFQRLLNQKHSKHVSLLDGIQLTKDLVSEPGNILHPDEYVNRLKKLRSIGLKITIFDKKNLKNLE